MIRILGDSFCDIVASDMDGLPKQGGDVLARIGLCAGGSGLNSTVHGANYVAVFGSAVSFELYSAVGTDFQGNICAAALNNPKIASVLSKTHGYSTGTCIVLSANGDRSFVTDRGCVNEMKLDWFLPQIFLTDGLSHFHFAGYFNCKSLWQETPELFRVMRSRGITTSLNPQYDATESWTGIREIAPYLNIYICNETEAVATAASADGSSSRAAMTVVKAAEIILGWGCEIVVITRSSKGASAFFNSSDQSYKKFSLIAFC